MSLADRPQLLPKPQHARPSVDDQQLRLWRAGVVGFGFGWSSAYLYQFCWSDLDPGYVGAAKPDLSPCFGSVEWVKIIS